MRLWAHDRFGAPMEASFTEMVVRDDHGNIVAAVVQYGPSTYEVVHVHDKKFHEILGLLGLGGMAPEISVIDARD